MLSLLRRLVSNRYVVLPRSRLTYAQDLLYTYHNADFREEPRFETAYRYAVSSDQGALIRDCGIEWRVHVLCWAATVGMKIAGDFVDCGAGSGIFSSAVLRYVDLKQSDKRYFLFDTFSGLDQRYATPFEMERNVKLGYKTGRVSDKVNSLRERLEGFPIVIVPGAVPETLSGSGVGTVSFLSIDMNCASVEVAALEYFWPRLSPGACVVLDDYGYPGCKNQKAAHDEFASRHGVEILSLPTCQGLMIKPGIG